jgi:alkylhydroperoxidase family enzyme
VLSGADRQQFPARAGALARFAEKLTATPWLVAAAGAAGSGDLSAEGFNAADVEAAVGVVAMFNYLTRVADATGIEFDYPSPLPAFAPDRNRLPAARPDRSSWPVLPPPRRTFAHQPELGTAWQRWRGYLLDSERPLTRRERRVLALAAAEASCDAWRAEELAGYQPRDATEGRLVDFAGALSRQPWRMQPADLDALRELGYTEVAILHVISVVAHQNGESRLAMGLAAAQT